MTWWAEKIRMVDPDACPNLADHTPMPDGYLDWHAAADRLSETHRQTRCRGCGRWTIWVPRRKRVPAAQTTDLPIRP